MRSAGSPRLVRGVSTTFVTRVKLTVVWDDDDTCKARAAPGVLTASGAAEGAIVRVYAVQRKPVAAGRGASGLAGRPPGGSSSL